MVPSKNEKCFRKLCVSNEVSQWYRYPSTFAFGTMPLSERMRFVSLGPMFQFHFPEISEGQYCVPDLAGGMRVSPLIVRQVARQIPDVTIGNIVNIAVSVGKLS
jgi:hypothetical protein